MEFNEIAQYMAKAHGVTLLEPKVEAVEHLNINVPLAAVPTGVSIDSLERFAEAPRHISGEVQLHRYADFIDYCKAFGNTASRVFVQPSFTFKDANVLATAVLDYPKPGEPSWSMHTVKLMVKAALEYKLLTALEDHGLMPQPDFALALRDIAQYCTSHKAADLIEIARTLTLQSKGEFANVEDSISGSVRFGYEVVVSASAQSTEMKKVEVPTELTFFLPVLLGGLKYGITVELLYRVPASKDQKVQMGIRIPERQFLENRVLNETADKIGEDTGFPVVIGTSTVPRAPGK